MTLLVVTGPIDLGEMDEDGSFRITAEQLLANASDPDGDSLSITNLKLSKGNGTLTSKTDGSWAFTPDKDWNGEVEFSYSVSDGQSNPDGKINSKVFVRDNSLYALVDGPTWTKAEANSQKLGGNLTAINSSEENQWITQNYLEKLGHNLYIGATDKDSEGTFKWTNGDKFEFTNWHPGNPDNAIHPHGPEDFVVIKMSPSIPPELKATWNDGPDHNVHTPLGLAEIPFIRRGNSAYAIVEGKTWIEAQPMQKSLAAT